MKTCATPFMKCNAAAGNLFSVQAGLPANDAINMASVFLDSMIGLLDGLDAEASSHEIEAAIWLAQMAKAAIDAVEVDHG